jgi:hypothetical protein
MLGCILIDTCQIEGNVDYPSWVRFFVLKDVRLKLTSRFVVITGLSAAVAWVLAKMFKLSRSQT